MDIGVDTHKQRHIRVALDSQGETCGSLRVVNTPEGWARALAWARESPLPRYWGVENSGPLGKGFAPFLLVHEEEAVHEVVPHRTAQDRKRSRTQDKTDHADALAMVRLLRAEHDCLPRVRPDDRSTELRLLSDHRDTLVVDRTRLINRLHAQMLQIDPCYAEKSGVLTSAVGVRYCAAPELPHADRVVRTRLLIVHQLARQIALMQEEIETVETVLRQQVAASDTPLLTICGVGVVVAARLIGELGTSPRVHSAAALAALAGIALVAVSSGGRHGHRLNRGGNRQLNRAFHLIALASCAASRWHARMTRRNGRKGRRRGQRSGA
jgi:transposase